MAIVNQIVTVGSLSIYSTISDSAAQLRESFVSNVALLWFGQEKLFHP